MVNLAGCRQTGVVSAHYRAPGWFTRNVFNRAVAFSTRHGVSILGSRVLAVKGHATGVWRTTPVNLLHHDGRGYLVSVRGHGHWVRNLRAASTGELRVGKHAEAFRSRELTLTTTRHAQQIEGTSTYGDTREPSSLRSGGLVRQREGRRAR
ncbi:MAG: nitroreductase/quinone reductase family protein [Pseudonocardiaceae bacterium]